MKKSIIFVSAAMIVAMFSCKPKDTQPPIIYLEGGDEVNVVLNKTYTEYGYTAQDNVDGDISSKVEVTTDLATSDNTIYGTTSIKGDYIVTYTATDKEGNVGTKKRTVHVLNQAKKYAIHYWVDKTSEQNPEISPDYTHKDYEVTEDKKTNNRIIFGKLANLVGGIYGDVYYNDTKDTLFIKIETQAKQVNDSTQYEVSGYDKDCYFTDTLNYTFQIRYQIDKLPVAPDGTVGNRTATDDVDEVYTKQ